MESNFAIVQPGERMTRHRRRPQFPIAGTMKPFGLYPIMAHPVLPGETLKSFNMKWRVLSKPIVNPLCGSWLEVFLFYVKLTDLDRELGEMFVSDSYSTSGYTSAGSDRYFTKNGQIDWIKLCTERLHNAYFIDDGETPRSIDGVRKVKLNTKSWYDNLIFKPSETALDGSPTFEEVQEGITGFQLMQMMSMQELTYEKYLQQYGVQSIRAEQGEPEILRYAKSWVSPATQVEPSTGTPTAAWSWNDEIKADKPKMFKEPGFLVTVATIRPKMFQENIRYSMTGELWGFTDWFPAYNLKDPRAHVQEIEPTAAIFATAFDGANGATMLRDKMDLLNHGEQFVNDWTNNPYALPMSAGLVGTASGGTNQDLRGEYCADADVEALFSSSASASDTMCFYEGMSFLEIAGHASDQIR